MRVKIGDKWHNSDDEPICIQISELEQKQIGNIDRSVATQGKYAIFPDDWSPEHCFSWMNDL